LPSHHFDVITLFEVIEHLKDPCPLISHCHSLLKPNGLMVIGTGNACSWTARIQGKRWEYFSIDNHGGHISFYNPKSMQALAEKTQFTVIKNNTRCVKFFEKGQVPYPLYRVTKLFSEMLNFPAKLFGQGHDMLSLLAPK